MGTTWRLVKTRHKATAFDGEGAKLSGGRWNSPGIPIVYTSDTPATSVLEMLVQDYPSRSLTEHWSFFTATFPDALVEVINPDTLPADWSNTPWPPALPAIGDRWIRERRSLVLVVPAAVLTLQRNFLINPPHPDRAKLIISAPQRFIFDARILNKFAAGSKP